jgi:glycerol-3-phosphate acyltransferase PlsY
VAPLALGITTVAFFAIFAVRRYVSLASILGALVFPVILWRLDRYPLSILLAGTATALLIVFRHRANIERLLKGKEHVFTLKGGKAA